MKKAYKIALLIVAVSLLASICSCNTNSDTNTNTNSNTDNFKSLYDRTSDFLDEEFHRVYDPYYDIQGLNISNWEENGNEATFFYKMTFIYYNRDPDAVEYIQEAKKRSQKEYEVLYNDYLEEKEANYEFKIVDNGESLELFSNVSPKGVEWQPTKIDDYIMK